MPLNSSNSLGFIHIPRTGGTYIEHLIGIHNNRSNSGLGESYNQSGDLAHLFGRNLQHLVFKDMVQVLGNESNSFYWFTIIRKPEDRLISVLNYSLKCPNALVSMHSLLFSLIKMSAIFFLYFTKKTLVYKIFTKNLREINIDLPIEQHLKSQLSYIKTNKTKFAKVQVNVPMVQIFPFEAIGVIQEFLPTKLLNLEVVGKKPNRSIKKMQPKKLNLLVIKIVSNILYIKDKQIYNKVYLYWNKNKQPLAVK